MKRIFGITIVSVFITLVGCKEQGCTDIFADNYSESAEEDDGTCKYGVDLVFWFDDERADFYYDEGAFTPMHVEVNGTDVGETNWFTTYETAPSCGTAGGTVNYKLEMDQKFESVEIKFVDQMGTTIRTTTESIAISDGDCQAIRF